MFDVINLIKSAGYLGLFAIIFAESGFFGFFFPGDSLLFTAGFLASQKVMEIKLLMLISFVAAVLGDSVGYAIGAITGPAIFKRDDSFFFHKSHLEKTRIFYEKYGPKTIVLARFIPIIRTFAPLLAGIGAMRYKTFFAYNLVGGALWAIGLPWLGWRLGGIIPDMEKYLVYIVFVIIILSILPPLREYIKHCKKRDAS